jgi:hypothetical protein
MLVCGHAPRGGRGHGGSFGRCTASLNVAWGGRCRWLALTRPEEERFVWENLRKAVVGGYWLGGYKAISGGAAGDGWSWVTSEPFAYTNWLAGNPDDYFGEDGLQYSPMADSARWNDIDRIAGLEPFVRGYLVEYEP